MEESRLITHTSPKSPISEALRTLRTNVEFTAIDSDIKTILITSALMSEGKSWISANLAVVFAQQGKKVLLIDADMRKGVQHKTFELDLKNGLSNYLADKDSNISKYIKSTRIDNLSVMTAGNVPPNPSELLSSKKLVELKDKAQEMFDIVIFDGPPSTVVTDGLIISRIVDTTLIVVTYNQTTIDDLKNVKRAIENVGTKIGGVILNKVETNQKNGYYYKYYSYYSNDGKKIDKRKKKKNG